MFEIFFYLIKQLQIEKRNIIYGGSKYSKDAQVLSHTVVLNMKKEQFELIEQDRDWNQLQSVDWFTMFSRLQKF